MDSEALNESPGRQVEIDTGNLTLAGGLEVPDPVQGVVIFAHGTGSGRFSPRNRYVASVLREHGLATLLMDLLTSEEEALDMRTRHLRFDVGLLAERLAHAIDWVGQQPGLTRCGIGLFGASTGAGAALVAAAMRSGHVRAVVSRGGRPDLAGDALPYVRAPTLLIVGGDDPAVLELNELAQRRMTSHTEMRVVPGATHLFEEPGALEEVARMASLWFGQYLLPETYDRAVRRQ